MFKISLIIEEGNSHDDIYVSVDKWNLERRFDSYHLQNALDYPIKDESLSFIDFRRREFKNYLLFWTNGFVNLSINQSIIFPIGIYDQYSDIFIFKKINSRECLVSAGYSVDFLIYLQLQLNDIQQYYRDTIPGIILTHGPTIFDFNELVEDFKTSIANIDHCQVKESSLKIRNYPGVTIRYDKKGDD